MKKLYIRNNDPLAFLYHFTFNLNNEWMTSILMAAWYIFLIGHSQPNVATQLVNHPGLLNDPSGIEPWIQSLHLPGSAMWVFHFSKYFLAIMVYLLENGINPFFDRIREIASTYPEEEVKFILTSKNREMVWSIGQPENSRLLNNNRYLGFNVYGLLLSKVYNGWMTGQITLKLEVKDVLALKNTVGTVCRTVLLLADSECAEVTWINGGDCVRESGATYHRLAHLMEENHKKPHEYKYVIIFCGVNLCRNDDNDRWERSWKRLEKSVYRNLPEDSSTIVIVNSPIWNPKAPFVQDHGVWLKKRVAGLPNTVFCDWSHPDDNPFVMWSGKFRVRRDLYNNDRFHINHCGFRELWLKWSNMYLELQCVAYALGHRYVSRSKPSKNKKTHIQ